MKYLKKIATDVYQQEDDEYRNRANRFEQEIRSIGTSAKIAKRMLSELSDMISDERLKQEIDKKNDDINLDDSYKELSRKIISLTDISSKIFDRIMDKSVPYGVHQLLIKLDNVIYHVNHVTEQLILNKVWDK